MTSLTFDSLTTARQLRDRGVPQDQAEAIADAIRASKDTDFSHLATKEELNSFKSELKADLRELELRIDAKNAQLETKMAQGTATTVKWIAAVLVLQVLSPLVQSILPLLKAH